MIKSSFLSATESWSSNNFQESWKKLCDKNNHLNTLFQTPQWFNHLDSYEPNSGLQVFVQWDANNNPIGICPIILGNFKLRFDIYEKALMTHSFTTSYVLGSLPMFITETNIYNNFFESMQKSSNKNDCIYFDCVPVNSFLWNYLQNSTYVKKNYYKYIPDGIRQYYSLSIPVSFDQYMSELSYKKRRKIRRSINKLTKFSNDQLELIRIEKDDQIKWFLDNAVKIAKNSWQQIRIGTRIEKNSFTLKKLKNIANMGILRSYILMCKKEPIAFRVGYQYKDIFYGIETGYDKNFAQYSPGKIMTVLVIKDLIEYNRANIFNFGIGYATWKKDLGNQESKDVTVILLKKRIKNLTIKLAHQSFRSIIHKTKVLKEKLYH